MKKILKRNQFHEDCKILLEKIKEYDKIAIFRHTRPDYDAIGSQMAMVCWIKDNFPRKDITFVGENHITLTPQCFPEMIETPNSWFKKPFLAIVLDTSTEDRISDERYQKATEIIKIDHHPQYKGENDYGCLNIVDSSICAAGELLAKIFIYYEKQHKLRINKTCASFLFKAIVGDSNRFSNPEVNTETFKIASHIVSKGINLSKIYDEMYLNKQNTLEFTKWVLENHTITKNGLAYYFMEKEDLERLHVPAECGKDCLHLFSRLENVKIWMSITWDEEKDCYRVSVRSNSINVEPTAIKWDGGGHPFACGAKLYKDQKLEDLIKDFDSLIA